MNRKQQTELRHRDRAPQFTRVPRKGFVGKADPELLSHESKKRFSRQRGGLWGGKKEVGPKGAK